MGNAIIREPRQQRSIEKKNKIIKHGFQLICEKGFHNTNTVEIAKAAGVSTGIIYQYFKDKRDIFIHGVDEYAKSSIMLPIEELSQKDLNRKTLIKELDYVIKLSVRNHNISKDAHEELIALQHSDEEVSKIFNKYEVETTKKLVEILQSNDINPEFIDEKAHIILGLIDNFCHEVVYHHHDEMNYNEMEIIIIKTIMYLLR